MNITISHDNKKTYHRTLIIYPTTVGISSFFDSSQHFKLHIHLPSHLPSHLHLDPHSGQHPQVSDPWSQSRQYDLGLKHLNSFDCDRLDLCDGDSD